MCSDPVVLETNLDLPLLGRGKVRDLYDLGDRLLFIASDRISAFDCILGSGIPCKGRVLTQMSLFWFEFLRNIIGSHISETGSDSVRELVSEQSRMLAGRTMVVRRAEMIPVECVARGYLSGSGWKEYVQTGSVCGIALPPRLRESERLPEPLFTPATKAQTGHDVNISFADVANIVGEDVARRLRDVTLAIYERASAYALTRGIILADTKFEFGFIDGELVLADEVLTPDSSR
ncbi:MAG: phosphoribosylaminoimidazolesuccinocarboxamide synthase, partial [Acidobacteriaceae bacterium]|nr:phosphoribosylaminoimidazolesuccinocarboxamide synthase [Acidobacteriaceae bacterium]